MVLHFFSATIASVKSCPAELFHVVNGLIHSGVPEEGGDIWVDQCNQLADFFADKIHRIRTDLGFTNKISTDQVPHQVLFCGTNSHLFYLTILSKLLGKFGLPLVCSTLDLHG